MLQAILLTTTLLCAPAAAQHPDQTRKPVSIESLRLEVFTPENMPANAIFGVAQRTVGRSLYLEERGGLQSAPADNLSLLSDRILVYDEPQYVETVLATLKKLDAPYPEVVRGDRLVAREYSPRYITQDAAFEALSSYDNRGQHSVQVGSVARNISVLHARGTLVLRDAPERVEEMVGLLTSLDQPAPQAMLTCYVVRGVSGQADPKGLPEDLVKNLRALVPGLEFTSVGFGMVRTSVAEGNGIQLRVESADEAFDLSLVAAAYDPKTSTLTADRLRLDASGSQVPDTLMSKEELAKRARPRQLFSTNAVLRGGEFTVLGASGSDPLFLVVHLAPVR